MRLPLVEARNVCAFIPGDKTRRLALKNINLAIQPGCHVAITGPNGAGKSILLKLLHGDLPAASGSMAWTDGQRRSFSRITGQALSALISPHIQTDCQSHAWDVEVAAIIGQPRAPIACACGATAEQRQTAAEILAELEALYLMDMRLPELSRGQLRLVLLARALGRKPRLLLLDEWESGLDQDHAKAAMRALEARADAMTMVFTGHRESAIPAWTKQHYNIMAGELAPAARQYLPAACGARPESGQTGGAVSPAREDSGAKTAIFALRNVSVYVDRNLVLRNLNWQMRIGEHWRVRGENGSGKSTFLRLLAGEEMAAADGTFVHYSPRLGREVKSLEEKRKLVALVSDLAEARYDYPLNVLETVLSGFDGHIGLWRAYSQAEMERARECLTRFLPELAPWDMSIRMLSTGQLRKVFLARSVVSRPEVLLLDEPFAGLDATSRRECLDLLEILYQASLSDGYPQIALVSHHDEDMPAFITHAAIFHAGRLVNE